jgi:hypothetical protein
MIFHSANLSRSGLGSEDVEDDAILVDGPPEIVLLAIDPDEHFIQMPNVSRPWAPTA